MPLRRLIPDLDTSTKYYKFWKFANINNSITNRISSTVRSTWKYVSAFLSNATPTTTSPSNPLSALSSRRKALLFNPQNKSAANLASSRSLQLRNQKVVVISIHGWYPAGGLLRRDVYFISCDGFKHHVNADVLVIGDALGASDKFAADVSNCIGQLGDDLDIVRIPLNGSGKIVDRVRCFVPILEQNWHHLISCDRIVFVSHSQGTPVAALLIAMMLRRGEKGCPDGLTEFPVDNLSFPTESLNFDLMDALDFSTKSIGWIAMAGIFHGPVHAWKPLIQYIEMDAALELFSLSYEKSQISDELSKMVVDATVYSLERGCRLFTVGGYLDPVVPLYSSLCHAISHPNIYRCVSAPLALDLFTSALLDFCIDISNQGLCDHGALIYMSDVMVGSVVGLGIEHSNMYADIFVYKSALEWLFDDQSRQEFAAQPARLSYFAMPVPHLFPYYLTWAFRSILEDQHSHLDPHLTARLLHLQEHLNLARGPLRLCLHALHASKL